MIWFKGENLNMTIEFTIIEFLSLPSFLNIHFLHFGPNLPKTGIFSTKQKS